MGILTALIAPAAEAFKARAARKQAQEQAVHETDIAKEEAWREYAKQNIDADVVWETEAQKQSGWKDEAVLIWFLSANSLIFIFPDYIKAGIDSIDKLPTWYTWTFMTICAASYGIRLWRRS